MIDDDSDVEEEFPSNSDDFDSIDRNDINDSKRKRKRIENVEGLVSEPKVFMEKAFIKARNHNSWLKDDKAS